MRVIHDGAASKLATIGFAGVDWREREEEDEESWWSEEAAARVSERGGFWFYLVKGSVFSLISRFLLTLS